VRIRFFQRWLKKNQAEGSDEVDTPQAGEFCNVETLLRPFLTVLVLVVLLVVSCLVVVLSAFEYRTLFNHHQELIQQRDELQVEWGQLLLEQSAWSANNRVEQQAARKLGMKVPEVNQIEIIRNER